METKRVYGISIDEVDGYNGYDIAQMTEEQRYENFVKPSPFSLEVLSVDEFFYHLNNDEIDTDDYYWFIASAK